MAIYPDKKGSTLTGRWRVEVQCDGKRLRGRFDTMEAAKVAEANFKRRLEAGEATEAKTKTDNRERETPRTLIEALRKSAPVLWRGKSIYRQALSQIEVHARFFGSKPLAEIKTDDIDRLIEHLATGGHRDDGKALADNTINRHLSVLHTLLDYCHKRGYIQQMPV